MEQEKIRNFVIISHIDHGKSTLADRFLELTKTVDKEKMQPQYLDLMPLERERGITIKMQPCRMVYRPSKIRNPKSEIRNKSQIQNSKSQTDSFEFRASNLEFSGSEYILNLIDTPGHVDFSYEVSRSLAAVEGAILLVDATKGIQAQTLANLDLAQKQGLVIIPVINKIDLPQANISVVREEIAKLLDVSKEEIFLISAKYGTNVEKLLEAVIEKIPPPKGKINAPPRALIFDSKYDLYKGVIVYIRQVEGKIKKGESLYLMATRQKGKAKEVGFFKPEFLPQEEIQAGEIGYIATGIKEIEKVKIGDTLTTLEAMTFNASLPPLPGYEEPKPMVFASIYPENPDDFEVLKASLSKLKLNDSSLVFNPVTRAFLGRGFLCGFLGTLHAEIVSERLKREFGLDLIISTPQVAYKVIDRQKREKLIYTAQDFPDYSLIEEIQEPWVS